MELESLSFSLIGRQFEKQHVPIQKLIKIMDVRPEDTNMIMPQQNAVKNKLVMFGLKKKAILKDNVKYPFNAVSRQSKALNRDQLECTYEPKYSPRYDVVKERSPSYSIQQRYESRSKSQCGQDYYTLNYSSFNDKGPVMRPQKKPKEVGQSDASIGTIYLPKVHCKTPDFDKQPSRRDYAKESLQAYDLLKVNYQRLLPRLDIGYVKFDKFRRQITVRSDRKGTPPSIRLDYDVVKKCHVRSISLQNSSPRSVDLERSKMIPNRSSAHKYSDFTIELNKWLNAKI